MLSTSRVCSWVATHSLPVTDCAARSRRCSGLLLRHDPLIAFEYGLSPVVHDLVAALEAKDPITRDHVVRVTELALRVGERMKLAPADLRDLALGALLHDIGKLVVPDHILQKPERLTDAGVRRDPPPYHRRVRVALRR